MTASNVLLSWSRMVSCSLPGNIEMMRWAVFAASGVCRVVSTRCPVSAAVMAARMDSAVRTSPMQMTSGSWRRASSMPASKERESTPTSRWRKKDLAGMKSVSMGSSMVTIFPG